MVAKLWYDFYGSGSDRIGQSGIINEHDQTILNTDTTQLDQANPNVIRTPHSIVTHAAVPATVGTMVEDMWPESINNNYLDHVLKKIIPPKNSTEAANRADAPMWKRAYEIERDALIKLGCIRYEFTLAELRKMGHFLIALRELIERRVTCCIEAYRKWRVRAEFLGDDVHRDVCSVPHPENLVKFGNGPTRDNFGFETWLTRVRIGRRCQNTNASASSTYGYQYKFSGSNIADPKCIIRR